MECLKELERQLLHFDESEEDNIRDANDYQKLCKIYSGFEQLLCLETKKDSHQSKEEDFPDNLNEFFDNIRAIYNLEWSFIDFMLYIYGIPRETVDKASKKSQEMVTKEFECVGKRREKLENLLQQDLTVLGMNEITEALRLTLEWMQEIETHLISMVRYLLILTPQNKAAKVEFREFKSLLEKIKSVKHGRVPISLDSILALLTRHLRLTENSKFNAFREKRKQPWKDIDTHGHLDQLTGMMCSLQFVFRIISSLFFKEKKKEEMVLYVAILKQSNEDLEEIQMKINELSVVYSLAMN